MRASVANIGLPPMLHCAKPRPFPTLEPIQVCLILAALAPVGPEQVGRSGAGLRERARMAVPSGIRAVAACPPDGGGVAPVVIATMGELWIIR